MKYFCALLLFGALFLTTASAQTIIIHQIFDDANNIEKSRPDMIPVNVTVGNTNVMATSGQSLVLPDGEVTFSHNFLPDGYTVTSFVEDGIATFIYHHTPIIMRSVSNTLELTDLLLTFMVDYPWDGDTFPFRMAFGTHLSTDGSVINDPSLSYYYTTNFGNSGYTNGDIQLLPGEILTVHNAPVGLYYNIYQVLDTRYAIYSGVSIGTEIDEKGTYHSPLDPDYILLRNVISGILEPYTNEYIPNQVHFIDRMEFVEFKLRKVWDGLSKGAITLTIYGDGKEITERPIGVPEYQFKRTQGVSDPYESYNLVDTYSIDGLPKYDRSSHEVVYSAKEAYMAGYMTMYLNVAPYADNTKSIYNGGTIINREVVTFSIRKVWEDGKEIHPNITFQLYQNGTAITWQAPEKFGSIYTWKNLPKYKDGRVAVYSVTENDSGYIARYENNGEEGDRVYNGGVIYNSPLPPTGDKNVPVWIWMLTWLLSMVGMLKLRRK